MRVCEEEGCEQKHHARGKCNKHYRRLKVKANGKTAKPVACTVCGARERLVLGLCGKHYKRLQRHGDPTVVLARQLSSCGTISAYQRHLRRGERPCQRCKNANARQKRAETQRKKWDARPIGADDEFALLDAYITAFQRR